MMRLWVPLRCSDSGACTAGTVLWPRPPSPPRLRLRHARGVQGCPVLYTQTAVARTQKHLLQAITIAAGYHLTTCPPQLKLGLRQQAMDGLSRHTHRHMQCHPKPPNPRNLLHKQRPCPHAAAVGTNTQTRSVRLHGRGWCCCAAPAAAAAVREPAVAGPRTRQLPLAACQRCECRCCLCRIL